MPRGEPLFLRLPRFLVILTRLLGKCHGRLQALINSLMFRAPLFDLPRTLCYERLMFFLKGLERSVNLAHDRPLHRRLTLRLNG